LIVTVIVRFTFVNISAAQQRVNLRCGVVGSGLKRMSDGSMRAEDGR
jgi:hypothetical protein